MDKFAPGDNLGGDHLIAHLNAHQNNPYIQTWQARAADGQEIVLKLCRYPWYSSTSSSHFTSRLEPIFTLPSIAGVAPYLGFNMVEWQSKSFLAIRRRYYPTRLMDLFPADVAHLPSRSLLDVFVIVADCLDTLEKEMPGTDFVLSPGDLLLDGDRLVITDFGMSRLLLSLEPDYLKIPSGMEARTEPERGVPLVASYPSIENVWRGARTDAQYAVAALYVYFRSRFMIFENPAEPFLEGMRGLPRLDWWGKVSQASSRYEKRGQLALPMLPDEHEKVLVRRALARESSERYDSGTAFVEALRDLMA